MAIYTIIRVQQQATDRMSEAIVLNVDRDFHVKDYIREPGAKPGKGTPISLRPGAGWLALALEQLGVNRKK